MIDLDFYTKEWSEESQRAMVSSDGISFSKFQSRIRSEARENAKTGKCYLCGRDCSSYCQSHTVPQFMLKNISKKGIVFCQNTLIGNKFLEFDTGVKKG